MCTKNGCKFTSTSISLSWISEVREEEEDQKKLGDVPSVEKERNELGFETWTEKMRSAKDRHAWRGLVSSPILPAKRKLNQVVHFVHKRNCIGLSRNDKLEPKGRINTFLLPNVLLVAVQMYEWYIV